ncbi:MULTISPECIES: septum formation initiator family protein [unclassified Moraxella]|uniref:septum formation initiator family protein n=1 Tax=unclassified Moraxella TaxID=2685852 RepID=UPI003AF7A450
MTYIRQLFMIIFAIVVLLALQYQYWFGTNGRSDLNRLNKQIHEQTYINSEQQKANQVLLADVQDLKSGVEAVEEHARSDLGLIKQGETFVQMSTAPTVYSTEGTIPPQIDSQYTNATPQAPINPEETH